MYVKGTDRKTGMKRDNIKEYCTKVKGLCTICPAYGMRRCIREQEYIKHKLAMKQQGENT